MVDTVDRPLFEYATVCPELARFHADKDSIVRIVRGPRGSGKSIALVAEMMGLAFEMAPQADGVRRSRFMVVRSTYREHATATIPTHKDMMSGMVKYGSICKGSEPSETNVRIPMPDGTVVEMHAIYLAVDQLDWQKIRGTEFTYAFVEELGTSWPDVEVVSRLLESAGRFPSRRGFSQSYIDECENVGKPLFRRGVAAVTNGPFSTHPLKTIELNPPAGWRVFVQPPPFIEIPEKEYVGDTETVIRRDGNVYIENSECQYAKIHSSGFGYWAAQIPGTSLAALQSSILGMYSEALSGKPVYPSFRKESVMQRVPTLADTRRLHIIAGMDTSGFNPGCVFTAMVEGSLNVLGEIGANDVGFEEFVEDYLVPYVNAKFRDNQITFILDPSNPRNAVTKTTAMQVLHKEGFKARLAPTNNLADRHNAVNNYLVKVNGFKISADALMTLEGLAGGHKYKAVKGAVGLYSDKPDKTGPYSHYIDALEYAALEHRGRVASSQPKFVNLNPRVRMVA
jgi:hypothetical protein